MRPANALRSAVSRYAALESWMMQLVTSAGKDRLGLNPPTLGFCAYRRTAFDAIGGFPPGAVGEDLMATVSLTRNGWKTRFEPGALADNEVVTRLRDYWSQHTRWAGNTFDASRAAGARRSSLPQRLETAMMSAGYADRLALVASVILVAADRLPIWLPVGYMALRGFEVMVALTKARVSAFRLPGYLGAAVVFFGVDIVATATATVRYARRRPIGWGSPSRTAAPESAAVLSDGGEPLRPERPPLISD